MANTGFQTILYNKHSETNISLGQFLLHDQFQFSPVSPPDPADVAVLATAASPVDIYWINQKSITHVDSWPANRKYSATSSKSSSSSGTGVIGVYTIFAASTHIQPLQVGQDGDLWVTPEAMFVKNTGQWVRWELGQIYRSPYDCDHRLMWSAALHPKYMLYDSRKNEMRTWKIYNGISCNIYGLLRLW